MYQGVCWGWGQDNLQKSVLSHHVGVLGMKPWVISLERECFYQPSHVAGLFYVLVSFKS